MCPCCIRKSILLCVQYILFRELWMTLHDPFVNNYIHNTYLLSVKCNTNIVLHF